MATPSRPRGRPLKGEQPAARDDIMLAAARAFALHGYTGVSLRAVNDSLGVSRNFLHQRFGSKDNLWHEVIDWAFTPFVEYLIAAAEPGDPLARLRALVRRFIEYSAPRPHLAILATMDAAAPSERCDYIFDNYISPVRVRFQAAFDELRDVGAVKAIAPEILFFLTTAGGTAAFGQAGLTARMGMALDPDDPAQVAVYADQVAEVLISGLSSTG